MIRTYRATLQNGQKVVSKIDSKEKLTSDQFQEVIKKNHPQSPTAFLKGSDTGPEMLGQAAGQTIGGMLGGLPGATAGGGIGGMIGAVAPDILKQTGQLLRLQRPTSPQFDRSELLRQAKRGSTFALGGELLPLGWRGLKAGGRVIREGAGALEGVSERLGQLRRLPLGEQMRVLRPGASPSIPSPEVAGAAQGAVEKRFKIPTIRDSVDIDKLYGVPKKGAAVGKTQIKGLPPLDKMSPQTRAAVEKQLGGAERITSTENPAMVARRVHEAIQNKIKPPINDVIVALRQTAKRMIPLQDGVEKGVLREQYGKLLNHVAEEIPEYAKARKLTHLSKLRDALMSVLPLSPKGDPYRFGVMRLIYLATSLAAGRFNPAAAGLMVGAMSPYAGAVGTMAGDALTKAVDPVIMNLATPAIMARILAERRRGEAP